MTKVMPKKNKNVVACFKTAKQDITMYTSPSMVLMEPICVKQIELKLAWNFNQFEWMECLVYFESLFFNKTQTCVSYHHFARMNLKLLLLPCCHPAVPSELWTLVSKCFWPPWSNLVVTKNISTSCTKGRIIVNLFVLAITLFSPLLQNLVRLWRWSPH